MDKKTVAETLGVGIRAVERYAEQGRLSVRYEKGKTRPVAVYNEREVKDLKAELEATQFHVRPAVTSPVMTEAAVNPANSEHPVSGIVRVPDARHMLAVLVEALQNAPAKKAALSVVEIAAKPILKLDEAARLTGFGRDVLLEAHEQGKLKMQIIKRAWRVKRTDLNTFIEKL
jgi:hypothetical protein